MSSNMPHRQIKTVISDIRVMSYCIACMNAGDVVNGVFTLQRLLKKDLHALIIDIEFDVCCSHQDASNCVHGEQTYIVTETEGIKSVM